MTDNGPDIDCKTCGRSHTPDCRQCHKEIYEPQRDGFEQIVPSVREIGNRVPRV